MRASAKLLRLCAVAPAVVAGSFIALISLSFLPGVGVALVAAGMLLASVVLGCGRCEALASRVFGLAQGTRPGERVVLEPALVLLRRARLAPQRLLVRVTNSSGLPATPIGRRTVILEPWLVQALDTGLPTPAEVAAAVGHAVASQHCGPARFDLATRLWTAPWTVVSSVVRVVAQTMSWVPAAGLSWRLRAVVGAVVVAQGFQPGGDPVLGLGTGALVAITYLAPAAEQRWRKVVQRDADRMLASHGLGDSLISFVHRWSGSSDPERTHRIHAAIGDFYATAPAKTTGARLLGPRELLAAP